MSAVMVRYRVRPEAAAENERLIREVFYELAQGQPVGLRYAVSVLEDGVTFVHVALREGEAALTDFPAFRAFAAEHGERCADGPVTTRMRLVGSY